MKRSIRARYKYKSLLTCAQEIAKNLVESSYKNVCTKHIFTTQIYISFDVKLDLSMYFYHWDFQISLRT